ncbi:hypothetical protein Tco_0704090 [Tanacetum coccineum]|uniref:Uncharacterized protein n=1 Tax=Tanacetum coccineum TaxID=301880 RepID=A0ABQ4Y0S0_9ASTR
MRHSMRMLVKDTRSQDGKDDKDNDKGSKSRSQSMKEQAYNKEQRERPRPHELNDKSNLIDLMKESSSSSDSEIDSCSKSCVKAYATLKEKYDNLSSDYKKSQFNLVSYKAGLESVEAKLAHYKKNEAVYEESINVLNLVVKLRDNALIENKMKLEKVEKERDELKLTLEKFQNSSKSLNDLLKLVNSFAKLKNQENNKSKSDKGYHAVKHYYIPSWFTLNLAPSLPLLLTIRGESWGGIGTLEGDESGGCEVDGEVIGV